MVPNHKRLWPHARGHAVLKALRASPFPVCPLYVQPYGPRDCNIMYHARAADMMLTTFVELKIQQGQFRPGHVVGAERLAGIADVLYLAIANAADHGDEGDNVSLVCALVSSCLAPKLAVRARQTS